MKKLILALVAVLAMVLIAPASALAFSDVGANHPDAEAIDYLSGAGIINGYADGSFKPDDDGSTSPR